MSTLKIDMKNVSEKLKIIIDDFKENKFLELENYLDYLVRTENEHITNSCIQNIKIFMNRRIKDAFLIPSEDVHSIFEIDSQTRNDISDFATEEIHSNNKKHNRTRLICQNVIGYSESKCKGLLLKKLNTNNLNDILNLVYEIGKLNTEINNLDLERLGERNKSKSGGELKANQNEKIYLTVNSFLTERKFDFYRPDGKESYLEMFNFLISNIENLKNCLESKYMRYSVLITNTEDLSFTIDKKQRYLIPNPKNNPKYTTQLRKFFKD